jgi:hypothetical protein
MVLFVLLFIVVVVVGGVSYFMGQERIRDIAAFGAAHSLTVLGSDWDLDDRGFALFRAGNRRYWCNVLRGQWSALPVVYCDYSYVVSEGRSQNTYSFSNVIATLGMQMPQVRVSPRSAIGALAEKSIGASGIRFESIDFNDRFDVQADDDAFAVELIDAQMIETLLGLDHGYHVVFGPGDVMVYTHRLPVAEIGALFDATALIVQRIPTLVRTRTVA